MSDFVLRDYQKRAVESVLKEWAEGRPTLLAMATGVGKTECFLAALERELEASRFTRALIVAHRIELLEQPKERIEFANPLRRWHRIS